MGIDPATFADDIERQRSKLSVVAEALRNKTQVVRCARARGHASVWSEHGEHCV